MTQQGYGYKGPLGDLNAGRYTMVNKLANGNLDQPPIAPGADDAIGSIAIAFKSMVGDLRALFQERQLAAASEHERLTELVAARTEQRVDSREQYRLIAESTNAASRSLSRAA